MRRFLAIPAVAIAALTWVAAQPSATAKEDEPNVAQLRTALTRTQEQVRRLESRVSALEASLGAAILEERPSKDPSTIVYTLNRPYMEDRLTEQVAKRERDKLKGKPKAEVDRALEQLGRSMRAEFASFGMRVELRADRSVLIIRRTKSGTTASRGIWSRREGQVIFTITHKNGAPLKPAEFVIANDDGGALELPGGPLPFPIRLRKEP